MNTPTAPDFIPGPAGARARLSDLALRAQGAALALRFPDRCGTSRRLRDGLRHIGGCTGSTFPPEQPAIDVLLLSHLVELADPEAAPVCGRYRPTELGSAVMALLGPRG